jgi:hypothetical protein
MSARTAWIAHWYETEKVVARAKALGWKEGEDGFLEIYSPEDDNETLDQREFPTLAAAVEFLAPMCAEEGKIFWRQADVLEFEVGGRPCRACTCRDHRTREPWKLVKRYVVEAEGVVEETHEDGCA